MRRLLPVLSLLAFFANPNFACSPGEEDFTFGEAEMRSAVEGTWRITATGDGGAPWELTIQIRESGGKLDAGTAMRSNTLARGFIRAAQACGSRTFVRSAGACVDISEMPLDVAYVSGNDSFVNAAMWGDLQLYTKSFNVGSLSLTLGDVAINVAIRASGEVLSVTAAGNNSSFLVGRVGQ